MGYVGVNLCSPVIFLRHSGISFLVVFEGLCDITVHNIPYGSNSHYGGQMVRVTADWISLGRGGSSPTVVTD